MAKIKTDKKIVKKKATVRKKRKVAKAKSKEVGRPIAVDITDPDILKEVKIFGTLAATQEEMADYFGVSLRTIERYFEKNDDDEETEFCRVYKKELAKCKTSLRRQQLNAANKGNVSMQIWMGKQLLGQKDKVETDNTNYNHDVFTPDFGDRKIKEDDGKTEV